MLQVYIPFISVLLATMQTNGLFYGHFRSLGFLCWCDKFVPWYYWLMDYHKIELLISLTVVQKFENSPKLNDSANSNLRQNNLTQPHCNHCHDQPHVQRHKNTFNMIKSSRTATKWTLWWDSVFSNNETLELCEEKQDKVYFDD